MPAAITAAMTVKFREASDATPKAYATLLTGPPRSKAIISPSSAPRTTALVPPSPSSQSVIASWASAMGRPMIRIMMAPVISVPKIGSTMIVHSLANGPVRRTRISSITTAPARSPPTSPPRNPALMATARRPATTPGAMPGRSTIPKAMKPARIGTSIVNAVLPIWKISAPRSSRLVKMSASEGKPSNATTLRGSPTMNETAMSTPPAMTNGSMYDTPVISQIRTFSPGPAPAGAAAVIGATGRAGATAGARRPRGSGPRPRPVR